MFFYNQKEGTAMLRSKKNCLAMAVFVIISATIVGTTLIKAQEKKPASSWLGELNYLYISEFEYGTGQSFNEAIAEMKDLVKGLRIKRIQINNDNV